MRADFSLKGTTTCRQLAGVLKYEKLFLPKIRFDIFFLGPVGGGMLRKV